MLPLTEHWILTGTLVHVDVSVPELGMPPSDAELEASQEQWVHVRCLLRYPEPYYADDLVATVLGIHQAVTGRRERLFDDQRDDFVWERVLGDLEFAVGSGALVLREHVEHPLPKLDELANAAYD